MLTDDTHTAARVGTGQPTRVATTEVVMKMDRICAQRGCPRITQARYCQEHAALHEKARGTKEQRGYGKSFQTERRRWKPKVEAGLVNCWRCGQRIHPQTKWHLGHDDNNRSVIQGPEHPACNLSAAGKSAHKTL